MIAVSSSTIPRTHFGIKARTSAFNGHTDLAAASALLIPHPMKSLLASLRGHLALFILFVLMASGHAQSPFTGVVAGDTKAFFLRADGTIWGTGWGIYGEFGEGASDYRPVPRTIAISGVVSIASGGRFTLFLKSDGTVLASGTNDLGQFGNGTTENSTVPVQVMTGVKAIAVGSVHSLFLKLDGSVWASGGNFSGELGDGTKVARSTAVQVLTGVKAISAGSGHSLFLKTDGSVWATGGNSSGQFGNGTRSEETSPVQIFTGVSAISAGPGYSMFLKTDGSAWATGANSFGQLGAGTEQDELTPVQVLSGVAAISAGGNHSLFLKTDGTAWAAGSNLGGQLGDGTLFRRISPVQVMAGISTISAGTQNSFFIKRDGTVWATGANLQTQLGDGTTVTRTTPGQVIFGTRMKAISAGGSHSLFLKANGSVWASGDNQFGQLGDGSTNSTNTPKEVLTGVKAISAGRFHSLFIKEDGTAWACGANTYGQLGNGTTNSGATPNPVQVLTDVQAVSAGATHSLFLKTDGTVWACGENSLGQLGDGTTDGRTTPTQIPLTDVKRVSAGTYHSLFLKNDGTAWATGWNSDGQLGTGPNVSDSYKSTPVQVLTGVGALDAGGNHSIFVKNDSSGLTYATGSNQYGQLGDNSYNPSFSPKLMLFGGVDVSAGGNHTMFMRTGAIYGSGFNSGALAIGNNNDQLTPVKTLTEGDQAVSAGEAHSLILLRNGLVLASGRNLSGQLGDGTQEQRPSPVEVTGLWIPEMLVNAPGGQRLGSGGAAIPFGSVFRGSNQSLTFTLKNAGFGALKGISPTFFGANASDFTVALAPPSEVSPEGTTTFTVRFTPSGNGARATTLRLASNDPDESTFDIPLSGIGVGVPEITVLNGTANLNDGGSASYGSVNRGSNRSVSFLIKNTGTLNLTGIAASLSGGNVSDYVITTFPAASLVPDASTTVSVRFTPAAAGARATTLRISSNDANENPFDILLSGTGVSVPEITVINAPAALVDGASNLAFGPVNRGSNKVLSLIIRNAGTANLTGINAAFIGGSVADYAITTAPAVSLTPNSETTIGIRFAPGNAGTRMTTLRIASNDEDENPFDIVLTGSGVSVPEIEVINGTTPLVDGTSSFVYGAIDRGSEKTLSLTIRNSGTASLTGIAASITGGSAADYAIITAPAASLAPNATSIVRVKFTPNAAGARAAILRIVSNDADENPFDIGISGSGINVPEIAVIHGKTNLVNGPAIVGFGSVKAGTTKTITLTVKNAGTAKLTKIAASLSGGQASQFEITTKPAATLTDGDSTTVKITFTPTGKGPRSTTLRIASNDADENPFNITLSGTATKAAALIAKAAIPGGNQSGKVSTQTSKDGSRHLVLTVDKTSAAGRIPLVEVSSDLVHWFSGPKHAEVLIDNGAILKVRDRTPKSAAGKRFIRMRWTAK